MITFKRILFPVDFSKQDDEAAPFVKAMAERFHSEVILLHAAEFFPVALISWKREVTINVAAVEAQVKNPPGRDVSRGGQEFRFDWLPVQIRVIRDGAHDSEIVGTIFLRPRKRHAASASVVGNRFHGSSSAMRLIG